MPARRCYRRRVIETRSADGASVSHDDGWRLMLHDVSISQLVATLWKRPRAAHIYTEPNAVNWRAHGAGETPNMFINDKTRKHRFDCCGTCRTRTSQSARRGPWASHSQTLPRAPTGRARTQAAVPGVGCACSHVRFGCRGPRVLPYGAATAVTAPCTWQLTLITPNNSELELSWSCRPVEIWRVELSWSCSPFGGVAAELRGF